MKALAVEFSSLVAIAPPVVTEASTVLLSSAESEASSRASTLISLSAVTVAF